MKTEELLELIKNGENNKVEFKSYIKFKDKKEFFSVLAKEAVGLANANGGYILLGIEDNGEISGCFDYDAQKIIESIYERTRPNLFTDIYEVAIYEKIILAIKVEKASTLVSTSAGEVYKRLGKNTKPMYPNEYAFNVLIKANKDFSAMVLDNTNEDDINYLEVYKLKERLRAREPESTLLQLNDKSFLKDLGLIKEYDGITRLTVAGLLFVGKDEAIKEHLPQAEIIYLFYDEKNDTEYKKRIDIRTTIISALDRLTEIIEFNNKIVNVQIGLFRAEIKDYPLHVFQEALLNAIAHRDYTSNGAIYVKQYKDKLIIENPGSFPDGITVENIITHPSVPRNKLISETLQQLKYVQRAGQGVDIIFKDMLAYGKDMPVYTVYNDAVVLTLKSQLIDEEFVKFILQEQDKNQQLFNTLEVIVLKYLKNNKNVTLKEISKIIQSNEEEAKDLIKSLIKRGYIEQIGRFYNYTYKVYKAMGEGIAYVKNKTIDYIRAKTMILDYIEQNKSITNKDVQELCGYDERKARYILNKLVRENEIILISKGRSSHYIKLNK